MLSIKSNFHLTTLSPIPFFLSAYLFNRIISFINYLFLLTLDYLFINSFFLSISIVIWFNDVNLENKEGEQTNNVKDGFKIGIIIFIITEILFFISWFWRFFHSSLSPNCDIGNEWPPFNLKKINSFSIPTWNTLILLGRGITVTWAHNFYLRNLIFNERIIITISLGLIFSINQIIEYYITNFTISDSIFGRCFFVTTGFHGFHVLIGTIFLLTTWILLIKKDLSFITHNNLFSFSIWYWHFVDIVWLFLLFFIYIWRFI